MREETKIDEEGENSENSYEPDSEYEIEHQQFIKEGSGQDSKSFKPNAVLTIEDKKTIEKVRDAEYVIPKCDILKDDNKLQKHFLDEEAEHFDENKKISKYAKIFMRQISMTPTQAAVIFQFRFRLKLKREEKRRKELMESSLIGFFIRKYF